MRTTPVVFLAATAAACAVPTDDAAPDRPDGGALALSTDDARVPPRGCTVTTSCVDGEPLARVACLSVPSGHVVHNHERRFENQGRHVYYDIADPWEGEHEPDLPLRTAMWRGRTMGAPLTTPLPAHAADDGAPAATVARCA
jgi:hypothetical protein